MSEQREIGWFWGGIMLLAIWLTLMGVERKLDRIADSLEKIAGASQ